jgi:N utilization substance protein A
MSLDLPRIIDTIHREKGIPKDLLIDAIQTAILNAARKFFNDSEGLSITIDPQTLKIDATRGGERVDPAVFGRIAAQTAKQIMIQKFREAERDTLFEEFESQKGDLLTGTVQRFEGGAVLVNLGKTDAILPRPEQIPGEALHPGDRIRAVVHEVKKQGQRVKIILSRTHPDFVRKLFELEIPEIADNTIQIRALAREAGYRTKVAVASVDPKVDAVGACVGVRGSRIKTITDELGGERIDIVRWNDSLQVLIPNALAPAEIDEVMLCGLLGRAIVLVRDDQLSLAIGRRGQNVRLASKLVGWDIEIMTAEELDEVIDRAIQMFTQIEGVDAELAQNLVEQGILSYDDLSVMEIDDLVATIEGLDHERAIRIVEAAEELAEQQSEESPRRKGGRGSTSGRNAVSQVQAHSSSVVSAVAVETGSVASDATDDEAALQQASVDATAMERESVASETSPSQENELEVSEANEEDHDSVRFNDDPPPAPVATTGADAAAAVAADAPSTLPQSAPESGGEVRDMNQP